MTAPDFRLTRDPFGRLVLHAADGAEHTGVTPVRTFPIAAPAEGLALVNTEGHEVAWIDRLDALPAPARTLLEEELASREFVPEIRSVTDVSSYATPSTWSVETDRGPTRFVLKGEEDIRRLGAGALLIADSHGIQYLIRDRAALDKGSRKILDRFL